MVHSTRSSFFVFLFPGCVCVWNMTTLIWSSSSFHFASPNSTFNVKINKIRVNLLNPRPHTRNHVLLSSTHLIVRFHHNFVAFFYGCDQTVGSINSFSANARGNSVALVSFLRSLLLLRVQISQFSCWKQEKRNEEYWGTSHTWESVRMILTAAAAAAAGSECVYT